MDIRRPRGRVVAATLILAGVLGAPAEAGLPKPGSRWMVHDHRTSGDGWHIEMTVAEDNRYLGQLVMHSERCDETVLTSRVRIRDDGTIGSSKPFTTSEGEQGMWHLGVRFPDRRHAEGSFQITTPGCDGGVRRFVAHGHRHRHRHTSFGTPMGALPRLAAAPEQARRDARRLWKRSLRAARLRFPTYRAARRLGFERLSTVALRRPLVFHLRHAGYARDRRTFDARRPESLVYWLPRRGRPVLVAFMYRVRTRAWPSYAKPLLGWHAHGRGRTVMTHLWMTKRLRSALANCMPVRALEAADRGFRFSAPGQGYSRESHPCGG